MIVELQKLIRLYLEQGKHRSLQRLASKAGVSATTIRRIAQGEVKTASLQNVLAILGVVVKPADAASFVKTHFPEAGKYFDTVPPLGEMGANDNQDEALERSLYDADKFAIISLASTPNGCSKDQVLDCIGSGAEAKLAELLDQDVLTLVGNRYRTTQKDFGGSHDNNAVMMQIGHCFRYVRDEHRGQQRQHCAIRTNGVSRDGQVDVHSIIQKALQDIGQVLVDKPGDVPVFLGLVMGTFDAGASNA